MTTELPRTGEVPAPRHVGGYLLGPQVGEGGMGVVHRSRSAEGTDVAVKVLRPHIAHDQSARERLRREVSTLERVAHPRVASVLDADVDGPAPFIVTEFVPGAPLDAVVAEEGPLGPEALVRLGRGLFEALGAIHAVGIVHRDLKPGNVLMVGQDPVVIDFGIAQVSDDVRLTMTGMVMGTPGYLAPEVVEGGAVTEATDWWGWAAVLAFAASGEPPFGRGPMTVVLDRVIRGRTQLSGVDPELRPLLLAALDPEPSARPSSGEVMAALEAYAAHRPVAEALTRPVPTTGSAAAAGGALGAAAAGGALGAASAGRDWGRSTADDTQVHQAVDHTRVAPLQQPDRTRMQPSQERPPQQRPASFDRQPGDYRTAPPPGGWPQQQGAPRWPDTSAQGGPYQPVPGGASAYPARRGDPRIGRPARTGTLWALLVLLVGTATLVPLVAWGGLALWSVVSRWVDRAITGLVLRRHEAGRRGSDVPVTMLAAPWHMVTSVLAAGLSLILPVAIALVTAGTAALALTTFTPYPMGMESPVPVALGTLMGVFISWWGPGGVSLRRGSRTIVRTVVPSGPATLVVVAFVLAAGLALGGYAVLEGQDVSWWPTSTTSGIPLIEPFIPALP